MATRTTTASSSYIPTSSYKTMSKQNEQQFYDDDIQRFDADTIRNRYGDNWKNLATNVREVTQPDGSIIKEYFIEDPTLLEDIQSSSSRRKSSVNRSDDDDNDVEQYQPSRNRIAQIKAKFESNKFSNVMASPATSSSVTTTNTNSSFQNSRKQIDELYARHRRASNDSLSNDRLNNHDSRSTMSKSNQSQNTYARSQSIESDRSKLSSFRRFNSADEADEEVSRIHRQGEQLRRQYDQTNPVTSRAPNNLPQQSNIQYEVVDEDGNPLAINDIQDLIKMSGVRAREVPQPDGTVIKEYIIDDPQLLSQVHSQQQQQSPIDSPYEHQQQQQQQQQRNFDPNAPPPPPRVPLRPPILFRSGGSANNDRISNHIQQIHVLEPQRHYKYLTMNGRQVQFSILNSKDFDRQSITDKDIRELTNAINIRLVPFSTSVNRQQKPPSPIQVPYHPPKPWHPVFDVPPRQRLGSDNQSYSNNNQNIGFQQIQADLTRSASSGALNQRSFYPSNHHQQPVFNQTQQDWNHYRNSNVHQHRSQSSEPFQSSAQFLPQQSQQITRSTYSPSSANYPYQGQQHHGVQLYTDYNQQRATIINNENTRI